MGIGAEFIRGRTRHTRPGRAANTFSYGVDYVLVDASDVGPLPRLFSRNSGNVMALHDRDHGGAPGRGRGVNWVRDVLDDRGPWNFAPGPIMLLAQPRVLGHVFNPVSFWLIHDAIGQLRIVIAEVTNTYDDRHSYLCCKPDQAPITARDTITAQKIFHVSPFQPVEGQYEFRFDITRRAVNIRINYRSEGHGGVTATLTGPRQPLTNMAIIRSLISRPLGSRRVLGLIHWQALRLWWKGASFRARPEPPASEVSE